MSDIYTPHQIDRELAHAEELFFREKVFGARHALDRALLTLSTGALALSLVFVDHLKGVPQWTGLLYWSWLLFTLSILGVVYSSGMTVTVLGRIVAFLDGAKIQEVAGFTTIAKNADRVSGLAMLCFSVSVVLFMLFVFVNRALLWQKAGVLN